MTGFLSADTTTTTSNDGLFDGVNDFFNSGTWLVIRNLAIFFVAVFWLASASGSTRTRGAGSRIRGS
jgi:hypothetical protein